MDRTCPACSARVDQQAPTCPHCGANLAADAANQATGAATVDQEARNTAVAAWVALACLAAVKASQGQPYRYPLTLRLVR